MIIGSGISGARIAWGLLEKGGDGETGDGETGDGGKKKRVVMLEARQTCSGASGRNGVYLFFSPLPLFPFLPLASLQPEKMKAKRD